ncbi:hypothetical protein MLD38_017951 [Melastoma candidum]|uniref:Uncharacterized protein n=1 Tax=Melastoma candidum TaxID=119954 RepID=A0ACB9QTE8_9MYRT|nr:hypothetical protein MLD38_017951 [Melastoma candidum]
MESGSRDGTTEDLESLIATTDAELLRRAWRNEKAAPEILRYEKHLVDRIEGQIQLMEETVDDYTETGVDPLTVSLYQMDLDRTQFLLRSYLRTRLLKIERFILHILKTDELHERLSDKEKIFARRCAGVIGKHLDDSVLLNLPENYQSALRQSTTSEEDDMVLEPRLDTFVVCKAREYISPSEFQDDSNSSLSMDLILEMEPGELSFIPYRRVQRLLESGKLEMV